MSFEENLVKIVVEDCLPTKLWEEAAASYKLAAKGWEDSELGKYYKSLADRYSGVDGQKNYEKDADLFDHSGELPNSGITSQQELKMMIKRLGNHHEPNMFGLGELKLHGHSTIVELGNWQNIAEAYPLQEIHILDPKI